MTDLLVLGSGVAGLSAALHARAAGRSVLVLTKGELSHSATWYAQGGVAAALGEPDSPALHFRDTVVAGAGLCDEAAVDVLVREGPDRVRELAEIGARFDDDDGTWLLAREGGHSLARVVHAGGDATGAEIERALVAATLASGCEIREGWFALALLVVDGQAAGVVALDPAGKPGRGAGDRHRDRDRRRRPVLRGHDEPRPLDRRRNRAGPAGPGRVCRHGVRAVPPDRSASSGDAAAAPLRGAARRRRAPARRRAAMPSCAASIRWPISRRATSSPARFTPACATRAPITSGSTPR